MSDWSSYGLPRLATNALDRARLTPEHVRRLTDPELLAVHGIGSTTAALIRAAVPYAPEADEPSLHDEQTVVNGKTIAQWRTVWRAVCKHPRREERVAIERFLVQAKRALQRMPA